jgi:hypothetical protein
MQKERDYGDFDAGELGFVGGHGHGKHDGVGAVVLTQRRTL